MNHDKDSMEFTGLRNTQRNLQHNATGILDVRGSRSKIQSHSPSAMCCLPCGLEVTVTVGKFGALLAVWLVISTGGLAIGFLICLYAVLGFPYSHVDFV